MLLITSIRKSKWVRFILICSHIEWLKIQLCKTMRFNNVVPSIYIDNLSTYFNNMKTRLVWLYISLINDVCNHTYNSFKSTSIIPKLNIKVIFMYIERRFMRGLFSSNTKTHKCFTSIFQRSIWKGIMLLQWCFKDARCLYESWSFHYLLFSLKI